MQSLCHLTSDAALVLDTGCGPGALTSFIIERAPSTRTVGFDLSRYMLTHQIDTSPKETVSLVQGLMPQFPFQDQSFDAVVSVQALSEVLCFSGHEAMLETIRCIKAVLREGGSLIVLDHQNPGVESIDVKMPHDLIEKMRLFQRLFEYRPFDFETREDGWIRMTLRNLYEFITKLWALGTPLEKEEMGETHTPYSAQELATIIEKEGFATEHIEGAVQFETYLKRYKIGVKEKRKFPDRFFILKATK
ncbi:MAG: class I SAM-dependent methyltransferase [Candidatus Thorarchaeota archaeon]|nr:class I SAM-dependent methyltransferase [Candidatus Thorarchaeota archaeon]